jgi:hypothetical protein
MNACIAWAGSEAVVDEPEDEELVDEGPEAALEVDVLSPVAPPIVMSISAPAKFQFSGAP